MLSYLEIALGLIVGLGAWIAKLKYSANKNKVEDVLAEREVSHRIEDIQDFEALNKEAYDELMDYINNDSLDKF